MSIFFAYLNDSLSKKLLFWSRFFRFDENFNEPHEEKAPLGADGEPSADIVIDNVESTFSL